MKATPDQWAHKVCDLFHKWKADRVVCEVNQGGDLLQSVLRTVDRGIPYRGVRANRGKLLRAEPVKALYEQSKVHHVGMLRKLEDQMTSFLPGASKSPDRLDALVWALTDLILQQPAQLHTF